MYRYGVVFIFGVMLIGVGCDDASTAALESAEAQAIRDEHVGLTDEELILKYGKAYLDDIIPVEDMTDEFRRGVQFLVLNNHGANEKEGVREMWWKQGDYFLSVWMIDRGGEWKAIDAYRWHKDMNF